MKKTLFLLLPFLLLSIAVSAQTQQGYVKTKGRMVDGKHVPGQGLKGATVSIQDRTPLVVQNDEGSFSFPISAKTFMVKSVKKNGYELVDPDVVRKPYNFSNNPIYLVMETPEQQTQDQLESERKIRRTLQRRLQQREDELEALKEANRITTEEYQQALQKLYSDQQNNEQLIADMAKEYAQMDYDQMDELNQRISDAILNGRLTEADSLLRSKGDMKSRIAKIKMEQQAEAQRETEIVQEQAALAEAKAGTQKRLEDIASDCQKFFDLCKLNMRWDSAAYYVETRAELDTANADWQFDAAVYFQNQNDFNRAEKYYVKALEIYRRLAKDNPQAYEPDLAMTLNNLAILYSDTQRLTESETSFLQALEIRRRLAKDNPQAYEPDVARTLLLLGLLHIQQEQYLKAVSDFEEALVIYRNLKVSNPSYDDLYQYSLNSLSQLYSATDDHARYYEINEERLPIVKANYQEDTTSYPKDYIAVLGSQSFQCIFVGQYEKSKQYAQEALAIDSSQHWINTNLAASLLLQGNYTEAETIYRQYKDELKDSFLQDLNDFEAAGVIPEERKADVERIKQLLNQ